MVEAAVLAQLSAAATVTELHEIGRGAAATVYRGRQPQFDRPVAVKILEQPLLEEKSLRRFARECQALGRVSQHPNIVTVHSSGTTESGHAYLVMEYCGGGSLAARLPADPPGTRETLELGVQLASALEWAHRAHMIHRDIKPANVLVSSLGEPVLADFGIASVEIGELSLTVHDSLTPLHAAPEVIMHGGGDVRSDVWSLASTLFTLANGRAPFAGGDQDTLLAMMNRITQAPLPPLSAPDSGPLLGALARAMTKDPSTRTPTAAAFGADLQAAQRAAGWPVTTFLGPVAPDGAAPAAPVPDAALRSSVRRTPLIVGAVLAALVAVGGGVALTTRGGGRPAPVADATPSTAVTGAPPQVGASAAADSPSPVSTASLPGVPAVTVAATDFGSQPVVGTGTLPGPAALTTRDLILGSGTAVTVSNRVVLREVTAIYGSGQVLTAWKDAPVDPTLPTHDFSRALDDAQPENAGIVGMKPGGRREIVVPDPDLGGADEVCVVDLVSILS